RACPVGSGREFTYVRRQHNQSAIDAIPHPGARAAPLERRRFLAYGILHWHHRAMQAPQIDGNSMDSQQKAVQSPASNGAPSTAAEASLPRRFERFTLLRQVARGGAGEDVLGTSAGIEGAERPVVAQINRRQHAEDITYLTRFRHEARIQSQLQHPGVAQVIEAATDGAGKPYVVVEHVEGRNLGEVRGRAAQLGARVGWADAVAIAVSMADALAHVHER